jgi:hypothetical protein
MIRMNYEELGLDDPCEGTQISYNLVATFGGNSVAGCKHHMVSGASKLPASGRKDQDTA